MLLLFSAASQAAQAVATVSKNIVGVNEVFQLQVSIDDNVNTNALDLSVLGDHFNYGSPQVSSGQNFINGW
ncbi:BatD protein [Photobacterium aphoticum]|uniref:BatD protein n=1 Tax=Photobacterium aphoticum TaxID=754436 RepID=A0A090QHT9_9GAMM|nr:BatD protein [Photobacterium aphoticum]